MDQTSQHRGASPPGSRTCLVRWSLMIVIWNTKTGDYSSSICSWVAVHAKLFCSSQIHDQQLGFRHLLDRITQPFAAKSGILHSAIRHVIDAECGHVSPDQTSDFEFFKRAEQQLYVPGKHSGL